MAGPDCDVSVIVPFTDDEEHVGAFVRRVVRHLEGLRLTFEVLAVDEGSHDNSAALLALLRTTIPQLKLLVARPRQGVASAARVARGRVLWIVDPKRAATPLASFSLAHARVRDGAVDAVVLEGRWIACRRTRSWQVVDKLRGRDRAIEKRFVRCAARAGLRLDLPLRVAT
jgi:glycosyltransferase involved in cell wall biosynthesis